MKSQNLWPINCRTKSQIKNRITLILLSIIITASAAVTAHADSRMDKMRNEFFKETTSAKKENPAQNPVQPKGLFEIQSVSKGTMGDYEYNSGSGTRQVRCINVKFKFNGAKDTLIPILYTYLYDNDKRLLDRLERVYMKNGASTKEVDLNSYLFKPRKTYILMFDYPASVNFKYFLTVVGNKKYVSAEVNPGKNLLSDFDFEEKDQYLKQSGKP